MSSLEEMLFGSGGGGVSPADKKKARGANLESLLFGDTEPPAAPNLSIEEPAYAPDSVIARTNRQRQAMLGAWNDGLGIEGVRAAHAGVMREKDDTWSGRQLGRRNIAPMDEAHNTEISPVGGAAVGAMRGTPFVNTFAPPSPLETAPRPTHGFAGIKGDTAVQAAHLGGMLSADAGEMLAGGAALKTGKAAIAAMGLMNAGQSLRQRAREERAADIVAPPPDGSQSAPLANDPGMIGGYGKLGVPAYAAAGAAGVIGGGLHGYGLKMAQKAAGDVSSTILGSQAAKDAVKAVTGDTIGKAAERKAIEAMTSPVAGPLLRNTAKVVGADTVGGVAIQSGEMLARGENPLEHPGQLLAGAVIQGATSLAGQGAAGINAYRGGKQMAEGRLLSQMEARARGFADAAEMGGVDLPPSGPRLLEGPTASNVNEPPRRPRYVDPRGVVGDQGMAMDDLRRLGEFDRTPVPPSPEFQPPPRLLLEGPSPDAPVNGPRMPRYVTPSGDVFPQGASLGQVRRATFPVEIDSRPANTRTFPAPNEPGFVASEVPLPRPEVSAPTPKADMPERMVIPSAEEAGVGRQASAPAPAPDPKVKAELDALLKKGPRLSLKEQRRADVLRAKLRGVSEADVAARQANAAAEAQALLAKRAAIEEGFDPDFAAMSRGVEDPTVEGRGYVRDAATELSVDQPKPKVKLPKKQLADAILRARGEGDAPVAPVVDAPPVEAAPSPIPMRPKPDAIDISGTPAERAGVSDKGIGKKPFSPTQKDFVLRKLDEAEAVLGAEGGAGKPVRFSVPDDGEITVRNAEQVANLRQSVVKNTAPRFHREKGIPPRIPEKVQARAVYPEGPDLADISGPAEYVVKFAKRAGITPKNVTEGADRLVYKYRQPDRSNPDSGQHFVVGEAAKTKMVRFKGLGDWPFFVEPNGNVIDAMTGRTVSSSVGSESGSVRFDKFVASRGEDAIDIFRKKVPSGEVYKLTPYATPERLKAAVDSLPAPNVAPAAKRGHGIPMRKDRGFALNPFARKPKPPMTDAEVDAWWNSREYFKKPSVDADVEPPVTPPPADAGAVPTDKTRRVRASDFTFPERSAALPDESGERIMSMNPKYMDMTPEQVGQFRQWAEANESLLNEKIARTTHAEIQMGAEKVVIDDKFLNDAFAGRKVLSGAEDLALGSRIVAFDEASALTAAKYRAALESGAGIEEAGKAMRKANARTAKAFFAYLASGTQKGQDLGARKIMRQNWTLDEKSGMKVPQSYIGEATEKLYHMMKGKPQESIDAAINGLASFDPDDTRGVFNFLRDIQRNEPMDASAINAYWFKNVLSGIQTQGVNAFNNLYNLSIGTGVKTIEAGMKRVAGDTSRSPSGEMAAMLKGQFLGMFGGAQKATQIMLRGYTNDAMRALDIPQREFGIPGVKNKSVAEGINPINWGTRGLRALDAFTATMAFEGELSRLALVEARKNPKWRGATWEQQAKMAADMKDSPTVDMVMKARKEALASSFMTPMKDTSFGFLFERIQQTASAKVPRGVLRGLMPFQFVVPFVRITYNIMRRQAHLSPIGLLRLMGTEDSIVRSGGKSRILAESLVVGALAQMGLGFYARMQDQLQYSAPRDAGAKEDFYGAKKTPNSIYGVPLKYMTPSILSLVMGGLLADKLREKGTPKSEKEFEKRMTEASRTMFDQSFLTQANQIMNGISEGNWEQFGANLASGFVPLSAMQRQGYQMFVDDRVREAETFGEKVLRGTVLQGQLPVRLDRFGGEIRKGGEADPVDVEIARLDLRIASPKRSYEQTGMQAEDMPLTLVRDRLRLMRPAKDMIRKQMNAPGWAKMSDLQKAAIIRGIYDKYSEAAAARAGQAFRTGKPLLDGGEYKGEKKYQGSPLR